MDLLVVMALLFAGLVVLGVVSQRRNEAKELERRRTEVEPVKKLAEEDVTALGVELQEFDLEVAGHELDEGANADYQRALDAYESAKVAAQAIERPDDIKHVTEILEDGRYAMACVRARVAGQPLPKRRPPCFFDPRHGLSVTDVEWTPPGGTPRDVPACALDAERVRAGADPDTRKVMVGAQRVPYYAAGPAYAPYAQGYFGGFGPLGWMFMGGLMFGGFGGFGADHGDVGGDMGGDVGDSGGGDAGGDGGGFDFGDFGGFDF